MDRGVELGVPKGEGEVVEWLAKGWRGGQVSKDVFKVFLGIGDDMNYDLGYGELSIEYLTILCSRLYYQDIRRGHDELRMGRHWLDSHLHVYEFTQSPSGKKQTIYSANFERAHAASTA